MNSELVPPDLLVDPVQGNELHRYLRHARRRGDAVEVTALGVPALLLTTWEAVRGYLAAQEEFPGGVIYQATTGAHIGDTFIAMDGEDHDAIRQLVMPAFRSRATARFVDHDLVPLAHELIDGFVAEGQGDLVARFAQVLPFWSISRKLGLPVGTEERQRSWALALLAYPVNPDGALRATAEVTEFLRPVVEQRRREPTDDVISNLLTNEYHGTRLSDEQVYSHIRLLYAVGATTTSDGLSSLLFHLLSRPALVRRCRADPDTIPLVVRESLRYEPPVANLPRLAGSDPRGHRGELSPSTLVLCSLASANRDETVFDRPDEFDVDRTEADILTFGFGSKFCPGSHLARQQMACAVSVLLERLADIELVEVDDPTGGVLRRCERLVARWRPA